MPKSAIIITSLAVVIIAAVGFIATRPASDMKKNQSTTASTPTKNSSSGVSQQPAEAPAPAESGSLASGSYIDYSDGIVAKTVGQKVLFFHAPWCPQCRSIEKDINQQGVPDGVVVIKVDYDSRQDLRQKYDVTLQTTFVKIDDQGNSIQKYTAYNEPTFTSVKSNLSL